MQVTEAANTWTVGGLADEFGMTVRTLHHYDARLTKEEQRDLFGTDFAERFDDHQEEAEQRWGETDAWRQSRERTASYGKEEWARIGRLQRGLGEMYVADPRFARHYEELAPGLAAYTCAAMAANADRQAHAGG